MDELSALPPEALWKHSSRKRTSSLNPRHAYTNPSPLFTTRAESPHSTTGHPPKAQRDVEIIAPTPRRHLLESSASQHWLNTPPLSPVSSRADSPALSISGDRRFSRSSPNLLRRSIGRQASFSTLFQMEKEHAQHDPGSPLKTSTLHVESHDVEPALGRRWIRWMHKRGIKQWVVPGVIIMSSLIKCCIGLGSYSGEKTPPMFGDYEAQRHWMELTVHLPTRQWYTYDLNYWGLDYPPLTGYVSWFFGIIAHWIEPSWVALGNSRGIETEGSKVFMRLSVILADFMVYIPALVMFARIWQGSRSKRTQELSLLTLLLQPALLLVDFGHFQYNSVMLGFTLLAINFFARDQDLLGAFFFVLSLCFKQMALYYSPAIGSYLLAKCIFLGPSEGTRLFFHLAIVTSATFILLFLPFLPPFAPLTGIIDPITRIFPFARGLFEDKVANFWCASNVVFKWKNWATPGFLVKISTILTALGFLPNVMVMLNAGVKSQALAPRDANKGHSPFLPLLPYALLASSMSFFLFSFQVHEKTILLPLMPITLLLSGAPIDSAVYSWGALVNNTAVFSMWPLLKRDGLGVQYIATLFLWNRVIGHNPMKLRPQSFIQILSMIVYAAALSLHSLEFLVSPPSRYPDLFPVLNVLISTPVFVLTWLWSIKCGIEVGWALGGLGSPSASSKSTAIPERAKSEEPASPELNGAKYNGNLRQVGARAVSLGYTQNRRRIVHTEVRNRRESMPLEPVDRVP